MYLNVSLLTIYSATKIDLIEMMPILQNMGFYVYDEWVKKDEHNNWTSSSNIKKID